MASQSIKGGLWVPPAHGSLNSSTTGPLFVGTNLLGTTPNGGQKFAFFVTAPQDGALEGFEYKLRSVTTWPTSGVKYSFQNLDPTPGATGVPEPDETVEQFVNVVSAPSAGWHNPGNFSANRTVAAGEVVCCVIQQVAGTETWDIFIDSLDMNQPAGTGTVAAHGFPGMSAKTGASPVWVASGPDYPVVALRYAGGTYEPLNMPVAPIVTLNNTLFNSGTNPNERGLRFSVPFATRLAGLWFYGDMDGNFDIRFYTGSNTTHDWEIVYDKDLRTATNAKLFILNTTKQAITANQVYRITVRPSSVTDIRTFDYDVSTAALMGAVEGGATFFLCAKTTTPSWTDSEMKKPWMGILLDQFEDGAGGTTIVGRSGPVVAVAEMPYIGAM
jgi:hypothetical protein